MENKINFQFPLLTIKKVRPLLSKDKKVFAYEIMAITQNGVELALYENKGLDLSSYIGQEMECLLEITKGEFDYEDEPGIKTKSALMFQYQWQKRLFEYFPELLKIRGDLDKAEDDDEDEDEDEKHSMQVLFEATATRLFEEWGLNGLNIGIYQAKPLMSSSVGLFFLNEYEFDEHVEELELNEKINIKIDEIYLRGIRPCIPTREPKKKLALTQPKPNEESIKPKPLEEFPGKKKGRFDSLLD